MPDEDEDLTYNIDEALTEALTALHTSTIDLLVNIGIISSLRPRWPEQIQENWIIEIQRMTEQVDDRIREVQDFASSLD